MINADFTYLINIFDDLESIVRNTTKKGDNIVEMFAWHHPHIAVIAKSVIGNGMYFSVSHYDDNEKARLYRDLLALYDNYLQDEYRGLHKSGLIIKHRERQLGGLIYELDRAQREYMAAKADEVADKFFERIGVVQLIHEMPPVLPGSVDKDIQLFIETHGVQWIEPVLMEDMLDSAFDRVRRGGYVVLNENEKTIGKWQRYDLPNSIQIVTPRLNSPKDYLIMRKT